MNEFLILLHTKQLTVLYMGVVKFKGERSLAKEALGPKENKKNTKSLVKDF